MKLILFHDDKVIKQLYENVSNVNYDGNTLSFVSQSTNYTFTGFQLYYSTIDDTSTLQVGGSVTDADVLTFVQSKKHIEILYSYENALLEDVTSSLIGSDGKNIVFGYDDKNQKDYNKIGVLFSLNTTLTSHIIGTKSHGAITISKSDFVTFINDCDSHESDLYNKYVGLRQNIDSATTVAQVNAITW